MITTLPVHVGDVIYTPLLYHRSKALESTITVIILSTDEASIVDSRGHVMPVVGYGSQYFSSYEEAAQESDKLITVCPQLAARQI